MIAGGVCSSAFQPAHYRVMIAEMVTFSISATLRPMATRFVAFDRTCFKTLVCKVSLRSEHGLRNNAARHLYGYRQSPLISVSGKKEWARLCCMGEKMCTQSRVQTRSISTQLNARWFPGCVHGPTFQAVHPRSDDTGISLLSRSPNAGFAGHAV